MTSFTIKRIYSKIAQMEQFQGERIAKIYVVSGFAIYTFSQVLVKGSTLSVCQTIYLRGLMICAINMFQTNEPLYVKLEKDQKLVFLQSFLKSLESLFYFISLRLLSISEAVTLQLTYSVWTQFQAYWILNEPISNKTMKNCAISLVGVLFITKPSSMLSFFSESETDTATSYSQQQHLLGCFISILGSFVYGISQILLRKIQVKTAVKLQHNHAFNIIIGSLGAAMLGEVGTDMYSLKNMMAITIISLSSYLAHTLFIKAYSLVSVAKLAPYTFSQMITAILCDFLIFQKLPDASAIFGSCLIMVSVFLTIFGQNT